jgi:hypothetical protein
MERMDLKKTLSLNFLKLNKLLKKIIQLLAFKNIKVSVSMKETWKMKENYLSLMTFIISQFP